jgi:hypothetical protein
LASFSSTIDLNVSSTRRKSSLRRSIRVANS